jgi:hypothetical protein
MLYFVPDTLLKVSLNTNKIDHHVIRYIWDIVESVVKRQKNGHHVICYNWHIFESVIKHQ